jgi:protein-disulfide isomerase
MKRYLPFAIILGVLLITVAAGIFLFQNRPRPQAKQIPAQEQGTPGAEPPHIHGLKSAPVSLEEFGDFECMPCYVLLPVMKNLQTDYGDKISVTFRQHPLSNHRNALGAARASEAAGLQGKFWEMHDSLYLNRAVWVPALDPTGYFATYASYLGLDVTRFKKDMAGEEVARRIKADQARGAALGVDRTPVIFVNGKEIVFSASPDDDLRKAIDAVLGAKPQ